MFSAECRQFRDVSNNVTLLPTNNTHFSSTFFSNPGNISNIWCSSISDSSPNVILTFTEPLYLLYAVVRGSNMYYIPEFSIIYENSSGESVTYTNVDGVSVRYMHTIIKMCIVM